MHTQLEVFPPGRLGAASNADIYGRCTLQLLSCAADAVIWQIEKNHQRSLIHAIHNGCYDGQCERTKSLTS